jgi:hypothetical protein
MFRRPSLFLAGALLLAGCQAAFPRSSSSETQRSETNSASATNLIEGKWHSVRISPSPRTPKIGWCEKINPFWWFGNSDEPVPPDWFKPDEKARAWKWFWRNPFHNFTHYVIGVADKKYVRSGRYPDRISNPNGGWNFTIARYGILPLPFVSYRRGNFEFYFGWRVRGNFGIKINFNPERTHPLPSGH